MTFQIGEFSLVIHATIIAAMNHKVETISMTNEQLQPTTSGCQPYNTDTYIHKHININEVHDCHWIPVDSYSTM